MAKRYGIWCEVWGGVTGSRSAWAKRAGEIESFAELEAAIAQAEHYEQRSNGNPYAKASFRYSARELEDA